MTSSTLDAALAAYSLTTDDLPGVAEAWGERFADLALPVPETEVATLCRLRPNLAEWEHVSVDDVTPRSDGTLTVEVDGRIEEDERSMYTCDTLSLSADEAIQFLRARESVAEVRRLNGLRIDAEQTSTGEMPVWWLLATTPNVSYRHSEARRRLGAARMSLEHLEEHSDHIEQLQAALDTQTPIPEAQQKAFRPASGYARGVKPLGSTGTSFNDKDVVRVDIVSRIARDLSERTPKLTALQKALDEAHALPAGALREFLIGERASRSYETTEGIGRSKKKVTRSYTPTSDLVSEHRTALEAHTRASADRDEQIARLAVLRQEVGPKLDAARTRVAEAESEAALIWAEGWPGTNPAPAAIDKVSENDPW